MQGEAVKNIQWETYGTTVIHPLALAFFVAMSVVLLTVPRARAVMPIALLAFLLPVMQRVVVGGLDFTMVRLLILVGWLRITTRGETQGFRWKPLDSAFASWAVAAGLVYVVREGTTAALIYRLGAAFDSLGGYFLFRVLLRSRTDVILAIRSLLVPTVIVGSAMIIESQTGRNMFAIFGGVPALTAIRDGSLRCQGAFSHPIMAGSFGAGMMPLFLGLLLAAPRWKYAAAAGIASTAAIVLASSSSGPLMALGAGIVGWAVWPFRARLRLIRGWMIVTILVLHFAREGSIWHLIYVRSSNLVGGTGWHRYRLVDAFFSNFGDWWLVGTNRVAEWGWGLQDLTNEYVLQGVRGGLLGLGLFIAMLFVAFGTIGRGFRNIRNDPLVRSRPLELIAWGIGVALMTHCVSFLSVSYFGQMQVVWYLHLGCIASFSQETPKRGTLERP